MAGDSRHATVRRRRQIGWYARLRNAWDEAPAEVAAQADVIVNAYANGELTVGELDSLLAGLLGVGVPGS